MKKSIPAIVEQYRNERGNGKPLSYRAFADELTAGLDDVGLSFQLVAYWESGERVPSMDILMTLLIKTQPDDWRHTFASELLSAKFA